MIDERGPSSLAEPLSTRPDGFRFRRRTGVFFLICIGIISLFVALRRESGSSPSEKVTVLVAKKDLDVGQRFKVPEDWFEFKDLPTDIASKDAITDFTVLKRRTLGIPLRQGDCVTPADLVSREFIPVEPPAGHRAVGVWMSNDLSDAGWASLPISRADIVFHRNSESKVIMRNVLVLCIDDRGGYPEQRSPRKAGSGVYLALTPLDALKVDVYRSMGSLTLRRSSQALLPIRRLLERAN